MPPTKRGAISISTKEEVVQLYGILSNGIKTGSLQNDETGKSHPSTTTAGDWGTRERRYTSGSRRQRKFSLFQNVDQKDSKIFTLVTLRYWRKLSTCTLEMSFTTPNDISTYREH